MYHNKIRIARGREVEDTATQVIWPGSQQPEDELNLIDLWLLLWRRKWLMLTVFLAALMASIIYTFSVQPVYISRAVLDIGQMVPLGLGGDGSLESRDSLVQRLKEAYRVDDGSEGPVELPRLKEVTALNKSSKNVVSLQAVGYTPAEAQNYLMRVAQQILEQHRAIYARTQQERQQQIAFIQQQQQWVEVQMQQVNSTLRALEKRNPSQASVLILERARLQTQQAEMAEKISQLNLSIVAPFSVPTTLMRHPTLPVNATQPRPVLYITLGALMGLILGLLVIFIVEFFVKVQEKNRRPLEVEVG